MRSEGLRRGEMLLACGIAACAAALALAVPARGAPGSWESAWGGDVVTGGGTGFEMCTVAANCKDGATTGLGGEMLEPRGVALDAAGNLYVADSRNNRIQKFDAAGNFLLAWGKDVVTGDPTGFEVCTVAANCQFGVAGGLAGELDGAFGVGVDAANDVYVADGGNQRIQVFDSQGGFKRMWGRDVVNSGGTGWELCETAANCKIGEPGELGGEMDFPIGVAFDSGGLVYVVEYNNVRIQVFDKQGGFQRLWARDAVMGGVTTY